MRRHLLVLVVALLTAAGCVAVPPPDDGVADGTTVSILSKSPERRIRDLTVRVRSRGCPDTGVSTGSGFVLDDHRIVTNRHVVAGADRLVVTTWDGHDEVVEVMSAATVSDLAVVQVAGELPPPAQLDEDPEIGDRVVAAGYPQGGEFRLSEGKVVGYDAHTGLGESGDVIAVDATIRQGNSGGPLLDSEGDLVGVVFAIRTADSVGLAIPVSRLARILDRDALDPVEPCSDGYVPTDELAQDIGIGGGVAPTAPSTTTTTTYPCPTGDATAAVTAVRSTPQPTYYEGESPWHDTFVEGTVTNRTSAPISVVYVEVDMTHPDGTTGTGTFFVDGAIPPGGTASFSGDYYGYASGPPSAGEARVEWYWDDYDDIANCG